MALIYGIDPSFIEYLDRLKRHEKVIWLKSEGILYCFAKHFTGEHSDTILSQDGGVYYLIFELIYDTESSRRVFDTSNPIGIVIISAREQLAPERRLMQEYATKIEVPALALLDEIIAIHNERGVTQYSETHKLARAFLERENIQIPQSEIAYILNSTIH